MEYQEIKERLQNIVETDLHPIPEDLLAKEKDKFYKLHQKSLKVYEEAREIIPGGVEHNLSTTEPFPLTMDRAEGYKMWDVDGNEYVDYLLCGAPIILGHHFAPLDDAVIQVIKEKGPSTGLTNEYELLAAKEIIKNVPSVEMVRFLQSGTEGNMAAIRIARTFTEKTKIIKIGANYHGWADQLVVSLHLPGTGPIYCQGIPPEVYMHTIDVPPNDFDAMERAFEESQDQGGVAAVLVEPIGGESGVHPVHPDWNSTIRRLCDKYGSLLIFDEVVSGFRLNKGGAQKHFDIMPDLSVFGKIVAHGYPSAGAVGGRRDVMEVLTRGLGLRPFMGGTMAANPITCAACYNALKLIDEYDAIRKATEYAEKLTKALNELFATRKDLPFFVYNYGSIMHYETTAFFSVDLKGPDPLNQIINRRKLCEEYQMVVTNMGVNTLAGSRMYACMQHDQEAFDKTIDAWEYLLSLIPES